MLERFKTCTAANNWNPDKQLARLPTFLDGRAYTLFRRLGSGQRNSFAQLCENLSKLYYFPEARETQRLELCNLKCRTDEDIDQYVYRLKQKFDRAHPELIGRDFVDIRFDLLKLCFLTGIPEQYQNKLREISKLTYEHAQLQARQFKAADQFEATRYSTAKAQPVRS